MEYFLATLFIIICVLLVIVVLLQKGRGGGLGAAFGGAGSSAFGTKTGDVFTWVTIVLTALFLTLAVLTTLAFRPPAREVPQPVFDPAPGEIVTPTKVAIAKSREQSTVYYTTDGTTPTDKSLSYEKPFDVYPDTTVKAIRFQDSKASAVSVGYYGKPAPASRPTSSQPAASAPTSAEAVISRPTSTSAPATVGG